MDMEDETPKKLDVLAAPKVEEPLVFRTTEEYYLDHLRSICARAENPTS